MIYRQISLGYRQTWLERRLTTCLAPIHPGNYYAISIRQLQEIQISSVLKYVLCVNMLETADALPQWTYSLMNKIFM
jgi:hypothetical protein